MEHAHGAMRKNTHAIEKKPTGVKKPKSLCSRESAVMPVAGNIEMPLMRIGTHSPERSPRAHFMPCKQACRHTTSMVSRYLDTQMAEASPSGLGGDTERQSRSSCGGLALDLGDLPFGYQAPIALCGDHILIRPLQDRLLNRSSPCIAQIQNAVGRPIQRQGGSSLQLGPGFPCDFAL